MKRRWWEHEDFDDVDAVQRIGCLPTWLIAMVVPVPLIVYGVICLLNQSALFLNFWDFGAPMRVLGDKAVALGLVYVAIGSAMHFRFGWTNWPGSRIVALPLFAASLILLIGAVVYLAVQMGPT